MSFCYIKKEQKDALTKKKKKVFENVSALMLYMKKMLKYLILSI